MASKHEMIRDEVCLRIIEGTYKPGEKMPTVLELSKEFSVNSNTAVKAMRDLKIMGILDSQQGSGYTVRDDADLTAFRKRKEAEIAEAIAFGKRLSGKKVTAKAVNF